MTAVGARRVLIVDGSNLAHCVEPRLEPRRALDLALQYAAAHEAELIAVFDGDGPFGAPGSSDLRPTGTVIATGSDSADPVLERSARVAAAAGAEVLVCTADRAVRDATGGTATRYIDPGDLLDRVATASETDNPQVEGEGATSRLATLVDENTAARLDALRRRGTES